MTSKQMLQSISLMDYSIGSDLGLVGVDDFNFFSFQPTADVLVGLEGAYLLLGEQTGTCVLVLFQRGCMVAVYRAHPVRRPTDFVGTRIDSVVYCFEESGLFFDFACCGLQ